MAATRREPVPERITVAIAGDSPVVCRALARLLEAAGYGARVLESARKAGMERALAGSHVLLLTTGTAPELKRLLRQRAGMPVLELVTTAREGTVEGAIPWPCTVEELGRRLSAAAPPPAQESGEAGVRAAGPPNTSGREEFAKELAIWPIR
ncbi:MAG: response regulator [Rubrobacter sp.]|nr:response regulator [Rubrobacter sp.]